MPAVALPAVAPVLLLAPYQAADWILERLTPGGRIMALCKGHLSLTDFVIAAARRVGPSALTIAVWHMSDDDMNALHALHKTGAFTSVRFIIPPPAASGDNLHEYVALRALFGEDCAVEAAVHAKVATLENDRWHVAIRGSLNMYACGHIEQVNIDDSAELCALVRAYAADPQLDAAFPRPAEARACAERLMAAHLHPTARFFGITAGYSLPDMIRAILDRTGPARVSIVTARLAKKDALALADLPDLRIVLGQSVVHLAKDLARDVETILSADRIRVAMVHAKLVTIRARGWSITIASSMNACANLRAEQYDITTDAETADHVDGLIDWLFQETPPGIRTVQTTLSHICRRALNDITTAAPARAVSAFRSERHRPALRLPSALPPTLASGPARFSAAPPAASSTSTPATATRSEAATLFTRHDAPRAQPTSLPAGHKAPAQLDLLRFAGPPRPLTPAPRQTPRALPASAPPTRGAAK